MKKSKVKSLKYIFVLSLLTSINTLAQWTQVASPPQDFITDHTYGFGLADKGYLVAGTDQDGNIRADFYQYDPVTDQFTQLDDFPGGARGYAIGDTWDGKAYFGFGSGGGADIKNDLWVFDPTAEVWTELTSCPCDARRHPAFIAHNDKVFVGLGSGPFGDLNDWWIYDIASDSWTEGPDFPSLPRHHPYQFGIGDFVYVGFGHGGANIYNTWYQYDPANSLWTQVESLPAEGRVAGQQFSWNDIGYVLSGEGQDHDVMEEGEFWSYDPANDSWEQLPSHPGSSRWAPASFVISDEVYIFNGVGATQSVSEAYKYELGDVISSTKDLGKEFGITIQPNPASDYLIIELKEGITPSENFSVFDVLGNELIRFKMNGKTELDVSGLANGVYILSSTGDMGSLRFVVAR